MQYVGYNKHNTKKIIIYSSALLFLTIVALIIWASLAPLNSAIVANGFVRVEDYHRQVQHFDGGIIESIQIKEGDYVKKGSSLILLHSLEIKDQLQAKLSEYLQLRLHQTQLQAQQQGLTKLKYSEQLKKMARELDALPLLQQRQQLLKYNYQALNEQQTIINSQIAQHQIKLKSVHNELQSLTKQQQLFTEETAALKQLAQSKFISKQQMTQKYREQTRLQSKIDTTRSLLTELSEKIRELNVSLANLASRHSQKNHQDLASLQLRIPSSYRDIQLLQEKLRRTEIRAPIDGRISRMKTHTVGGVIQPGAILMEIVPVNESLVIEAHVQPKDIKNIRIGQQARIKITAYNPRHTPTIKATVRQASPDRLNSQQGGYYYSVVLDVESYPTESMESPLNLYPGMPAEVIIPTTKRTLMGYFFNNLLTHADRSMREN